ncbi:MAG: hypothetical protein J6D03_00740 [Clostridia bacterium]|nr:hypothetical protein [Clostridia bacterium]
MDKLTKEKAMTVVAKHNLTSILSETSIQEFIDAINKCIDENKVEKIFNVIAHLVLENTKYKLNADKANRQLEDIKKILNIKYL